MEFARGRLDNDTFDRLGRDHNSAPMLCIKSQDVLENDREKKRRLNRLIRSERELHFVGAPLKDDPNEWTVPIELPV
jgi:hypothetical protein